ncbi:MAG TPA: hypothetical protein VNI57_06905, partial [Candidatus Saccharimonadales bacterium]|nr:hypothetical protein [Candidatus Saccharimonadales bacterium]
MPRVEGHPDFGRLEARLLDLVGETKSRDAFAPLLVVVPTGRLWIHLQSLMAARFGALLNVTILHHRALAGRAGPDLPRLLPRGVREAILERCAGGAIRALDDYLLSCPGALPALLTTMEELRDAGIDPAAASKAGGISAGGRGILGLYGRYCAALSKLEGRGLSDPAGIRAKAAAGIAGFASKFERIIHYGAYELIGSNLAVMRAMEAAGPEVIYLIPSDPESPAFEFSRLFAEEMLGGMQRLPDSDAAVGGPGGAASGISERLFGGRVACLYDEEAAAPPPLDGERIRFFHAQGAEAELRETALRILDLVRSGACEGTAGDGGAPAGLGRIGVVFRSAEPYAPLLVPVLEKRFGIPFTTNARLDAAPDPHVRAALDLARSVLGGWERRPLMDLLRSGLLANDGGAIEEVDTWDLLARRYRISRGLDNWTKKIPQLARESAAWLPEDADDEARASAEARAAAW